MLYDYAVEYAASASRAWSSAHPRRRSSHPRPFRAPPPSNLVEISPGCWHLRLTARSGRAVPVMTCSTGSAKDTTQPPGANPWPSGCPRCIKGAAQGAGSENPATLQGCVRAVSPPALNRREYRDQWQCRVADWL